MKKLIFATLRALLIPSLISLGILGVSEFAFADTAKPAAAPAATTAAPAAKPAVTPAAATTTPASATPPAANAPAPAAAASLPAIAQAIWVKGNVTATQPGGTPRTLQRRSEVYEHDVVATDKDSSGEIGFTDGSLMSLNGDSAIKIDEYSYKKSKDDKSVINLVKGGFRTITGAIPKENPDGYKMNTPIATIGVRGTEYVTVLSPEKGLLLKIEKGAIKVINAAGSIDLTECTTGGGVSCDSYGVVKSFDIKPETTAVMPPEMANVAPVTSLPSGFGAPGKPGGTQGPSKSVGSFCVGLLDSFLQKFHSLFG